MCGIKRDFRKSKTPTVREHSSHVLYEATFMQCLEGMKRDCVDVFLKMFLAYFIKLMATNTCTKKSLMSFFLLGQLSADMGCFQMYVQ